jgi:MFS family permease
MPKANRRACATATVAFALVMAILLGFFGFLTGGYLGDRLGPRQADPDEMATLGWGVLVGRAAALSGFAGCLFFFWPRANEPAQHSSDRPS